LLVYSVEEYFRIGALVLAAIGGVALTIWGASRGAAVACMFAIVTVAGEILAWVRWRPWRQWAIMAAMVAIFAVVWLVAR
jgi:hypothetical protein